MSKLFPFNSRSYFIARDVITPEESLQKKIFPWIEENMEKCIEAELQTAVEF